jgi:two-component system response regulator MprA
MFAGPILIVDDDPLLYDTLSTALTLNGFQTRSAANGREALDMIAHERPALILLDLHMPVMDGATFMRELQSRGAKLPIVVMSADEDGEDVARQFGIAAYLRKPIALTRLLSAVAACGMRGPAGEPGVDIQRGAA